MIFAKQITADNIDEILQFSLQYESSCIHFVVYLLEKKEELKYANNLCLPQAFAFYSDGVIVGASCLNSYGFFVYCLPYQDELLYALIAKLYDFSTVFAFTGEAKAQNLILSQIKKTQKVTAKISISYFLMTHKSTLQNNDASLHLCKIDAKSLNLRQATVEDASFLLTLQSGYEKEEVLKKGEALNKAVCLMNLERILKNQTVYIAEMNGTAIAKANTNAKGVNWNQIGGVYTLPKYRRCGIAFATVATLVRHIHNAENKNASLFVKRENEAALALYKKLGFKKEADFQISYLK